MKRLILFILQWAFLLVAAGQPLSARTIDPSGSRIAFTIHSRLATVAGIFARWKFQGHLDGPAPDARITIDVKSIDTNNHRRDSHLCSADFFDTRRFPSATFDLTSLRNESGGLAVTGTLAIKGIRKSISLRLYEKGRLYRGNFFIHRRDFGITYDSALNPIEDQVEINVSLKMKD